MENEYKLRAATLKKRLTVSPTTYQTKYYNHIIEALKAAGIKPYEAIEKTADAYRCINQKNLELAWKNHVEVRLLWKEEHND